MPLAVEVTVICGSSIKMTIWTKVAGTWREVHTVSAKVNGVWTPLNKVQTRVLGVWQDVYGGDPQVTSPVNVVQTRLGEPVHAGIVFQTDGGLDLIGPALITDITPYNSGEWWENEPQANIGSNWRVRCSAVNSGSWSFQGAAVGTWVRMDAARQWSIFRSGMLSPGVSTCDADFEIASYPSGAVQVSFNVFASAEN